MRSRDARWATTRPTCRAGTATACPSSCRWTRTSARRRRTCRRWPSGRHAAAYAEKFVDIQREEFERLGVLGEWDDPYLTMAPAYQATIVRAAGRRSWRRASSTRPRSRCTGASPAAPRWPRPRSSTTRTTSARRSTSRFPLPRRGAANAGGEASRRCAARRVSAVIWTTTPWTLPANLAWPSIPRRTTRSIPVEGTERRPALARALRERGAGALEPARRRRSGEPLAEVKGADARGRALPPSLDRPRLARRAGRLRHPRHRHRRRAHRARPRLGRLPDRRALRPRHLLPGGRGGPLPAGGRALRGPEGVRRQPEVVALLRGAAARCSASGKETHSYPICWRCKNPIIFRATEQWFIGLDQRRAARAGARGHRQGALVSRPGARSASAT